jgi:sugar transferase (PEP-CTERM/EpsH1 system associated)
MRVLYLCHRIPYPPDKGDKIRAFHQLRALASRHEVDVFTLADDGADMEHRQALEAYCRRLTVARINPKLARLRALPFLLTNAPLTLPYFYSAKLAAEVGEALQRRTYDRIFVYCSAMAQYVERASGIPIVTDLVDVDSDKWIQYAAVRRFPFSALCRREGRCLRDYERRICERSACVLVATEREGQLARQISPDARVHVVPNGVDTAYFDPHAVPPEVGPPTVIFTGDLSYFPNEVAVTFFVREVLPLVRQTIADVRFLIVGRNPGPRVRQLQRTAGVEVTGFVPDVRAYLARARVAVAPFSIAAGIQNKILEAMAYGLPVVATRRAAQGLAPSIAGMVEIGESAEELASQIVLLLRDPERCRRKGLEGRRRVADEYRWETALNRMLQLVEGSACPQTVGTSFQSSLA